MDLDPKIKRLVDDALEYFFSDKKWIKQVKNKTFIYFFYL